MTEEALVFVCDEAACKEDPFFYEMFPMDDRWAIIRAILKAVETASADRVAKQSGCPHCNYTSGHSKHCPISLGLALPSTHGESL